MTRGKPSAAQLNLADKLDGILNGNYFTDDGIDTRNYGGLDGIIGAKKLLAPLLGVSPESAIVYGNSSLSLMYGFLDMVLRSEGSGKTWSFLAPTPGYDRHFWICDSLGIKLIPISFTDSGPDLNQIKEALSVDPDILGMWCVPKHSNPTGHTYSEEVIRQIASLARGRKNPFYVMWDNAYGVHDFEEGSLTPSLMEYAVKLGTEDSIACFCSTSKISFAGAGLAALGLSEKNRGRFMKYMSTQNIGPDKVNQLRHVRFYNDFQNLVSHMRLHGEILKPKFQAVTDVFQNELAGVARWNEPTGGYFISLYTPPGCAKEVVRLAKEAGVVLTPAGAAFPGGIDPDDSHIRIAPSCPTLEEIEIASKVIASCVKQAV